MRTRMFEKVLNQISLDERITDGVVNLENEAHMNVLREFLVKKGIDEGMAIEYTNKVLEGKYPERQAYNAKGILVTFPTPEYKAQAIKRGTHFEENPVKSQSNLFGGQGAQPAPQGDKQAPAPPSEKPEPKPETNGQGGTPKTSLPLSQASGQPTTPTDTDPAPKPDDTAATTAAPQQSPTQATPPPEPTTLPPPTPKPPQEKQADKDVIKKMLQGDDFMLEEISQWMVNNAPLHIKEAIDARKNKY